MAKDPAFLFYPNDWLGGTMGMTFEEKGAYLELLMLQFNRGHMTADMINHMVGHLWDKVKEKFIEDENGLWYNSRLELEQQKRKNFTKSRKNNLSGKNQFTSLTNKGTLKKAHMPPHMENENENEVVNVMVSVENRNLNDAQKKKRFEAISKDLFNSKDWLATVSDLISKPNDVVIKLLDEFLKEIRVAESYTRSISEIKKHFGNWAKKNQNNSQTMQLHCQPQNLPKI